MYVDRCWCPSSSAWMSSGCSIYVWATGTNSTFGDDYCGSNDYSDSADDDDDDEVAEDQNYWYILFAFVVLFLASAAASCCVRNTGSGAPGGKSSLGVRCRCQPIVLRVKPVGSRAP